MPGRRPTVADYRQDPYYPEMARAVDEILRHRDVVAPVDVLVKMGRLTQEGFNSWRHDRVPYLERVIRIKPRGLVRLLQVLGLLAYSLNLKPSLSWTAYVRWHAKSSKDVLRFTEEGDPKVEEAFATHFIWTGKGKPLPCEVPDADSERSGAASSRKAS